MSVRKVSLNSAPAKKPSLASLKPDKSVGVAARTRAVKKIEAAMTTRVTTTKVTKKVGERKVVIKRAIKKEKRSGQVSSDTVLVLPTTISIRAREKALVFLEAISRDFETSAKQVAYVAGLCFILLGASMSLAFTTPFSGGLESQVQTAQLSSTLSASGTTQTLTNNTTAVQNLVKPTYTLLDPLPVEVQGKTTHRLETTHAQHVDVKLYSLTAQSQIGLQVEDDPASSRFVFSIERERLEPGEYVAKIIIKSDIDQSIHTFTLGSFLVPYPISETTTASQTLDISTTQDSSDPVDNVDVDQVLDTATSTTTENAQPIAPTLRLRVPSPELSGQLALRIETSAPVPFVKLSVRSLKSITPILNSSAEFRKDAWYYFFNTENIPNGEYELTAYSRFNDAPIKSNAERVKISNFVQMLAEPVIKTTQPISSGATTPASEPVVSRTTQPVTETQTTTDSTPLRTFSEFSLEEVSELPAPSGEMTPEVKFDVDAIFTEYKDELRALLQRYAIAQQSGDPLMLELAKQSINEAKQNLINDVLNNPGTNHLADNIDEQLNGRFDMLQKRIDTFEELRRTASNNESASDKDNDGISDYDEQFLYGSNPEVPDTDSDGVLDGIEIMGGYNPTDPSAEAVIVYELPQESFAQIEDELLKVEAVAPVIRNDLDEQDPEVQAEIRGKGLPNSYVTIYIFSTPTIVTVRTDQDGSFVYTFEKELEDGEHEVYVAVTDNTGAIVAHSSPFKFIKEAQAFTPVDANDTVTSEVASYNLESLDSYNVIIGLGILALGLILLMLGVGLREREKITMTNPVPSNDIAAT